MTMVWQNAFPVELSGMKDVTYNQIILLLQKYELFPC